MKKIIKFINEKKKKEKIKYCINRLKFLITRENLFIPTGYCKGRKDKILYTSPKVSILLPIYNHANVAKFAIKSILNQTYQNIELIILDDGSTDNLEDILKPYYTLNNVKVYKQENQKLPRALTHLHSLATGDFVTWTSADNIMHPKMIEKLVFQLITNPDAALVYGDVYVIDKNNRPYLGICRDTDRDYKHPNIFRLPRNEKPLSIGINNYINACFLYRKENSDVLCGKYADDIIGAEDYDFWLRMEKTGHLVHIKNLDPLYYYRVHDNSMSHELETKKAQEHQSRLKKLQVYEQMRIDWCKKRPNIKIEGNLTNEEAEKLKYNFSFLPVDINNISYKNIIFSKENLKNKAYFKILDSNFILKSENKEIVNIFKGLNIPRDAYWARNAYSHSYYQADLIRIKKPIFGTHINSTLINIENVETIIKNNKNIVFVILDEIKNDDIIQLTSKYSNFYYYPNRIFGLEYQTYSYFARIISFDESNEYNNYKNLLLGYATGRRISFYNYKNKSFFEIYPFTIPFEKNIELNEGDYISENDIEIMDNYINYFDEINSLKKCISFYNGFSQELFIERPKYEVNNIPKESAPRKIN
mgnify:CR=1 FL=1